MKLKTETLSGPALNAAVWIAQGGGIDCSDGDSWLTEEGICALPLAIFQPSKDWRQGGEIIARERITVRFWDNTPQVSAYVTDGEWMTAEDPLTAALRAFVASKLGDWVELPDNLARG